MILRFFFYDNLCKEQYQNGFIKAINLLQIYYKGFFLTSFDLKNEKLYKLTFY